jgi:hypothetical protein
MKFWNSVKQLVVVVLRFKKMDAWHEEKLINKVLAAKVDYKIEIIQYFWIAK